MEPQNPAVPTPPSQPVVPSVPPIFSKKNNFPIILLCVLLLITLSTTGYLFLQVQGLTKQLAQSQVLVQTTPIPSPAEASAQEGTANWKTFTFEPISHTFKYPTDWTAVQCEGGIHLFTQPTQRNGTSCETPPFGVVFIAFNNKPIETGYLKSTDYTLEKEQNITTPFGQATKRVIKQVNEAPGSINYIEITFKGTNKYYYLISTENPQYETIVDQILSTFKFTN